MKNKLLSLLITDDNPSARAGMRALLGTVHDEDGEVAIFEAANGREAVWLTAVIQPNIVLMDINMPQLNGIEATRLIKKQWPTIKVIILTMHTGRKNDALAAGADLFLGKGCPADALLQAIFS